MLEKNKKMVLLLLYAVVSFYLFWCLEYSEKFQTIQNLLRKKDTSDSFYFFLVYNLFKYFCLLFSVVSSGFFIYQLVKNDTDEY